MDFSDTVECLGTPFRLESRFHVERCPITTGIPVCYQSDLTPSSEGTTVHLVVTSGNGVERRFKCGGVEDGMFSKQNVKLMF